jgi:putative FmdB family regulatory protein
MPIYEYECRSCGVHFDRKQKWQDEPVKVCPECEGEVRKVIQPVGIVFKGSGFYKTDNSSSGQRAAMKDGDEERLLASEKEHKLPPVADAKDSSKGEGKPDSQSEPKSGSDARSDTRSEPKTGPDPRSESRSGSDSKAEPKPGSDSRSDKKSEAKAHATSGESGQDRKAPR